MEIWTAAIALAVDTKMTELKLQGVLIALDPEKMIAGSAWEMAIRHVSDAMAQKLKTVIGASVWENKTVFIVKEALLLPV